MITSVPFARIHPGDTVAQLFSPSSLSVCLSLPLTPFPPTHTHTLFSVEQFDRKFQYHYTFTPKYFLCHESSKNKDILLRNHNAVTTPRKTNINTIVLEI